MSNISYAAHLKFLSQCQNLFFNLSAQQTPVITAEQAEKLKADIAQLQQLAEVYAHTVSRLPDLAREYKELQRRIRIKARKIQLIKSAHSGQ